VGGIALAIFYWNSVLPPSLKASLGRLGHKLRRKVGWAGAK